MNSFYYRLLWFLSVFPILMKLAFGVSFEFLHPSLTGIANPLIMAFFDFYALQYCLLFFSFYILSLLLFFLAENKKKIITALLSGVIFCLVVRCIIVYTGKSFLNHSIGVYVITIFQYTIVLVLLRLLFMKDSFCKKYGSLNQQKAVLALNKVIMVFCYSITFFFLAIGALYDERYFIYGFPFYVFLLNEARVFLKTNKWVSGLLVLFFGLCVLLYFTRFYNSFAYPLVGKIYTLDSDIEVFQDSRCSRGNTVQYYPSSIKSEKRYALKKGTPFQIEKVNIALRQRNYSSPPSSYTITFLDNTYSGIFRACDNDNRVRVSHSFLLSSSWGENRHPPYKDNLRRYLETKFYDFYLLSFLILVILRKVIAKIRRI